MTRSVLEVLKFVPPKDTLAVSSTCRQWLECSELSELWWTYCDDGQVPVANQSPKAAFKEWTQATKLLVFARKTKFTVISAHSLSFRVIELPVAIGMGDFSAYCLLSVVKVMCFGATYGTEVYEVNLKTFDVKSLPSMSEERRHPGVIRLQDFVYVFGGVTDSGVKYHLHKAEWIGIEERMPETIDALVPAHLDGRIFLADNVKVHVFHTATEHFTTLPFSLPTNWYYGLAFIEGKELVIAQCGFLSRWNTEKEQLTVTSIAEFGSGYYSNCPPVWWEGKLYSLYNDVPDIRGLLVYDSLTKEFCSVPHPAIEDISSS